MAPEKPCLSDPGHYPAFDPYAPPELEWAIDILNIAIHKLISFPSAATTSFSKSKAADWRLSFFRWQFPHFRFLVYGYRVKDLASCLRQSWTLNPSDNQSSTQREHTSAKINLQDPR